jgi:hypothetical protein
MSAIADISACVTACVRRGWKREHDVHNRKLRAVSLPQAQPGFELAASQQRRYLPRNGPSFLRYKRVKRGDVPCRQLCPIIAMIETKAQPKEGA